jgi:hypothetical protein
MPASWSLSQVKMLEGASMPEPPPPGIQRGGATGCIADSWMVKHGGAGGRRTLVRVSVAYHRCQSLLSEIGSRGPALVFPQGEHAPGPRRSGSRRAGPPLYGCQLAVKPGAGHVAGG